MQPFRGGCSVRVITRDRTLSGASRARHLTATIGKLKHPSGVGCFNASELVLDLAAADGTLQNEDALLPFHRRDGCCKLESW